jgi:gp16 family phage-associated protein
MTTQPKTPPTPRAKRAKPAAVETEQRKRVRAAFATAGIAISDWARANGFAYMTVVDVLHGRRVGTRGEAHRVAVSLGLKQGQVVDVATFKPGTGA